MLSPHPRLPGSSVGALSVSARPRPRWSSAILSHFLAFPEEGVSRGAGGARVLHTHPGDPMALGNLQILSSFQLYEQLYIRITCCLGELPWWLRG